MRYSVLTIAFLVLASAQVLADGEDPAKIEIQELEHQESLEADEARIQSRIDQRQIKQDRQDLMRDDRARQRQNDRLQQQWERERRYQMTQ